MLRPIIFSRGKRKRIGKGFSREELKAVGLSIREARKLGIAVDKRRKSCYEENIQALKNCLSSVQKIKK